MDDDFMRDLDDLRGYLGIPLSVSSGYRCPDYNDRISSTGRAGPHTTGKAVDMPIIGEKALRLIVAARQRGFHGIGVKQHGPHEKRFIHIDKIPDTMGPRPWLWTYP